jgi:hypothetical protein
MWETLIASNSDSASKISLGCSCATQIWPSFRCPATPLCTIRQTEKSLLPKPNFLALRGQPPRSRRSRAGAIGASCRAVQRRPRRAAHWPSSLLEFASRFKQPRDESRATFDLEIPGAGKEDIRGSYRDAAAILKHASLCSQSFTLRHTGHLDCEIDRSDAPSPGQQRQARRNCGRHQMIGKAIVPIGTSGSFRPELRRVSWPTAPSPVLSRPTKTLQSPGEGQSGAAIFCRDCLAAEPSYLHCAQP